MQGVQRARFCYNRKDPETTYLPVEALYNTDGTPLDGRLELCGWGIYDADLSEVAKVSIIATHTPKTNSSQELRRYSIQREAASVPWEPYRGKERLEGSKSSYYAFSVL